MTASVVASSAGGGMMQFARDLLMLTKPKILVLLGITCLAGSFVATKGNSDLINLPQILLTLFGLMITAGGANSINMWFDRDIDAVMDRTINRPLPAGRLTPTFVLCYGIGVLCLGTLILAFSGGWWAAFYGLAGGLFYVFIYTIWLKRRTVQNIVIGGAAGAFPPLVGWAAVQGNATDILPWLMFAIIFLWTPPHFWALALMVNRDYTRAKVPMYPVVHGAALTKIEMLRYQLVLFPVTLVPALTAPFSWGYIVVATLINLWWLKESRTLFKAKTADHAQSVFTVSIYYLAAIFAALVAFSFI